MNLILVIFNVSPVKCRILNTLFKVEVRFLMYLFPVVTENGLLN